MLSIHFYPQHLRKSRSGIDGNKVCIRLVADPKDCRTAAKTLRYHQPYFEFSAKMVERFVKKTSKI